MGQVQRIPGLVRMMKPQDGYGFIVHPNGEEIYFHKKDIRRKSGERIIPKVGDRVCFAVQPVTVPGQRDRAIDVEVLG